MISTIGCVLLTLMAGATRPGAVMRVWQIDRDMSALSPIVPGQDPNAWIHLDTIDLDEGEFGPFEDRFIAYIDGSITIEKPGAYEFQLTSDDGSQLWIGGRRVIDHDGLHGATSMAETTELKAGTHPFQIKFFENHVGERLELAWRRPGAIGFTVVPESVLTCDWPAKRPISSGTKEIAPGFSSKMDVGPEPAGPHNVLTDDQKRDGWVLLFDGSSAGAHWRGFKKDHLHDGWQVKDGALVRVGGGGDIVTRRPYDDFDLYLDWKVEHAGNSGIFFNGSEDGYAIYETAPEMQILDNVGHGDGATALNSAGANYALHAPPGDCSRPAGQWNRARIRVHGDHVQYWLNGVKTADYVLNSPDWNKRVAGSKFVHMPRYGTLSSGLIGLQDHGDEVSFRNIRILELDPPVTKADGGS